MYAPSAVLEVTLVTVGAAITITAKNRISKATRNFSQ
jgi:hypothetical protein